MISIRFSLLVLAFLGLTASCKVKEGATKTALTGQITAVEDLKKYYLSNPGFENWLTGEISLSGEFGDYSGTLSGSMRMQRDSAIWINFKYMGFEVARVWVTTDSVKGIIPIQNQFFAEGLENLKSKGFPAELGQLQALLTGAPIWVLGKNEPYNINKEGEKINILGQNKAYAEQYSFFSSPIQLDSQYVSRHVSKTNIALQYTEYTTVAGAKRQLPTGIDGQADQADGSKMNFEIVLKNLGTETSKPMRFEIPTHYKRIGL